MLTHTHSPTYSKRNSLCRTFSRSLARSRNQDLVDSGRRSLARPLNQDLVASGRCSATRCSNYARVGWPLKAVRANSGQPVPDCIVFLQHKTLARISVSLGTLIYRNKGTGFRVNGLCCKKRYNLRTVGPNVQIMLVKCAFAAMGRDIGLTQPCRPPQNRLSLHALHQTTLAGARFPGVGGPPAMGATISMHERMRAFVRRGAARAEHSTGPCKRPS